MAFPERPVKRVKLIDDESDASDSAEEGNGGTCINGFTINEKYAKRFEYNSKRVEKERLEEKYGKVKLGSFKEDGSEDDVGVTEDESSSEDETEDDDGDFATKDVDEEIMATLHAIKSKDPRVYDTNVKFYKDFVADEAGVADGSHKEKPLYLQDYHRRNLLNGYTGDDDDASYQPVRTYQDEQDKLRMELVSSMHAAADNGVDGSGSEDNDPIVVKAKPISENKSQDRTLQLTERDVQEADKDPETYLSNFMAARAWVPNENTKWQPFDSDDSDEELLADEVEEAYNLRFEDPSKANEKLMSFARDVGKYSVRRDEKNSRKRAREKEREKQHAAKQQRDEERARLRKLRIEEAEEKVKKIKEAAGMAGMEFDLRDWQDVIEGDFDDEAWEHEMRRKFGDDYYAGQDADGNSDDDTNASRNKRKLKKPKWDDDIDIDDIVPDFSKEDVDVKFSLSSGDEANTDRLDEDTNEDAEFQTKPPKGKSKKDRAKEKSEAKRTARLERRQIEEMVDAALPLNQPSIALSSSSTQKPVSAFRYRQTSPTSFGLSARDILFAKDAQLNQFAGLKKLATFRDAEKKRKDKKRLSKKARLREWRKDTFGNPEAPTGGFERLLGRQYAMNDPEKGTRNNPESGIIDGTRKKKRSRKAKTTASATA